MYTLCLYSTWSPWPVALWQLCQSINQWIYHSLTQSIYLSIHPPIHLRADSKDASSPRFTSPTGCEVCLFTPVTPTEMIQMMWAFSDKHCLSNMAPEGQCALACNIQMYRARQKVTPRKNSISLFRHISSAYRRGFRTHILQISLQCLAAFQNYNHLNLDVHFSKWTSN